MQSSEYSLRQLVEKWPKPAAATPVHVMEFGRLRASQTRVVRIEATGTVKRAMYFFRHGDGAWYVFPPDVIHPKMSSVTA